MTKIGLDVVGFVVLVIGIVLGVIPGPGGTPVILLGLSILSINNTWAARWRKYILEHHSSLTKVFFPDQPLIKLAWDLFGLGLIVAGGLVALTPDQAWWLKIGGSLIISLGCFVFLTNRQRGARLVKYLQKKR